MSILIAGGMGYIGSHTIVNLLNKGYDVIVGDNLYNSKKTVKNRIEFITGKTFRFYNVDFTNEEAVIRIFEENNIEAVINFAALKAVGESVQKPLEYYYNNLTSTLTLLKIMKKYNCKNFVFSSSATVYGEAKSVPISEESSLSATNPYGQTKLMIEKILKDICKSDKKFNIAILRYFNPIGAHKSGIIGENSNGIPNNLIPYVSKVAIGELDKVRIFGGDYETHDGTGVRDYIHVMDLSDGHIKALEKLKSNPGLVIYNLGTGKGYSVLDVIKTFSKVSGANIDYEIVDRRAGDIGICYADATKANKELKWHAKRDLLEMCEDAWRWQRKNSSGY